MKMKKRVFALIAISILAVAKIFAVGYGYKTAKTSKSFSWGNAYGEVYVPDLPSIDVQEYKHSLEKQLSDFQESAKLLGGSNVLLYYALVWNPKVNELYPVYAFGSFEVGFFIYVLTQDGVLIYENATASFNVMYNDWRKQIDKLLKFYQ